MGTYDATWNPFSNVYSPYANYPFFNGAPNIAGAPQVSNADPFAAYTERALANAVAGFFMASAMQNQNFAPRPELEMGLRMLMQQMNQTGAAGGVQAPPAQMPAGAELQQYGELIVMMALFMVLAQRMMQNGGRDFGGMNGANWGGGQRVNNGWPSVGTETEKGGGARGPLGTIGNGSPGGQHLARVAERSAMAMGTVGMCYRGAKRSIAQATGVNLSGGSAYQAANQLAGSGRFREVSVSQGDLRNLPAGAVVVWGQTSRSPHGHISVALGDGREASDHVQRQITSLRGASNYRVFMPTT